MSTVVPKRLTPDQYTRWMGMGYRWRVLVNGVDVTMACRDADRVNGWAECYTETFAHVRLEGTVEFKVAAAGVAPVSPQQARSHVSAIVEAELGKPEPKEQEAALPRRGVRLEGL